MNRHGATDRVQELKKQIDYTIGNWLRVLEKRQQLDNFQKEYSPPEPPQEFENVQSLAEFLAEKERYDNQLRGYIEEFKKAEVELTYWQEALLPNLPEGIPLTYKYQAAYQDFGERAPAEWYKLVKVSSGEKPSIQIEELGDRS